MYLLSCLCITNLLQKILHVDGIIHKTAKVRIQSNDNNKRNESEKNP